MTKALYKFHWDCGRMGDVEGIFIADKESMKASIGKQVYFGEILGKHSKIYGELEEQDVELVTEDEAVIDIITKYGLCSGYNPLDYISEEDEE